MKLLPSDFESAVVEIAEQYLRAALRPKLVGYCGAVLVGLFPMVGGDACLVDDGGSISSLVVTVGGMGTAVAAGQIGLLHSNVQRAADLRGFAVCVGVSVSPVQMPVLTGDVGGEVCIGSTVDQPSSLSELTNAITIFGGVGLGVNIPSPFLDPHLVFAEAKVDEVWDYPQCWSEDDPPRMLPSPSAPESLSPGAAAAGCIDQLISRLW